MNAFGNGALLIPPGGARGRTTTGLGVDELLLLLLLFPPPDLCCCCSSPRFGACPSPRLGARAHFTCIIRSDIDLRFIEAIANSHASGWVYSTNDCHL